jgi:hypothetical protein
MTHKDFLKGLSDEMLLTTYREFRCMGMMTRQQRVYRVRLFEEIRKRRLVGRSKG